MYTDEMITNNKQKKINLNTNTFLIIAIVLVVIVIIFILLTREKEDTFVLVGSNITIKYNEEYIEPGYKYIDKNNNDLTNKVQVVNNINNKVPGTYKVIYRYNNQILTRVVTVLKPDSYDIVINYTVSNTNITNENIIVTYSIIGDTFYKVELPNGNVSNELNGSFTIEKNGTYIIKAYNEMNQLFQKEIVINNIYKDKPTGTCKATIDNKETKISVDITDKNSISKYEYYDSNKLLISNSSNEYVTSSTLSNNILVKVFDKAGNTNDIICEIINNRYHDPIKPNADEKIVYQEEADTLKVYISKKSSYYLTRIWVKDAYTQFNKAASPEYGKNMYTPKKLIEYAINSNSLQNKLIVGFNASGFYLKGTYDAASVSAYPAYDRTAVGSIVINNGVLVRNAYDHAVKQWYLTGITKDNKMVIFEDNVASGASEIASKQVWAKEVINSGIRNTFNFAGPVIQNGQKLTSFSHSMPNYSNDTAKGLQVICQIDENNFVLFTSHSDTRNTAINKFLELGCKTATNFDGGGSVALLYKSKNSTEITGVTGGSRALPEAGYFTE